MKNLIITCQGYQKGLPTERRRLGAVYSPDHPPAVTAHLHHRRRAGKARAWRRLFIEDISDHRRFHNIQYIYPSTDTCWRFYGHRASSACMPRGPKQGAAGRAHRSGPLQRQGRRRLARILAVLGGGNHLGGTALGGADGPGGQERSQWVSL